MPKDVRKKSKAQEMRHDPLATQMVTEEANTGNLSAPGKRQKLKRQQVEEVGPVPY
jgi:hypothetical protein